MDDHRSGKIVIQLNGRYKLFLLSALHPFSNLIPRINKTGVISPRYNIKITDFEKWVVKLLPSRQFGYIVLTTSAGIMDHEEARRKHVAGKIIGYGLGCCQNRPQANATILPGSSTDRMHG